MTVSEYIKQLQAYEEYAFSWDELFEKCNAPEPTLRKELVRLAKTHEIINLRKGFYLIIPPRYQNLGKLPVQLYLGKLFKHLNKKYYVGLYSAATIHGASHQKVQQDYVVTVSPALRNIEKGKVKLRFFKTRSWPSKNIIEKKSDAGLYNVSSPALTAADLVYHQAKIGGINRMLANLEELAQEITVEDIDNLLSWYTNKSTLQRLGYLMEELGAIESIPNQIYNKLKKEKFYPILLSPKKEQKAGSSGNRWKVDVNIKLESDI